MMNLLQAAAAFFSCFSILMTLPDLAVAEQPSRRVVLNGAILVANADQPLFVQYAIEELVAYLKESTGVDVPVMAAPRDAKRPRILVGASVVEPLFPEIVSGGDLGEEGYRLKTLSKDGVDYVVAAGATARGTKAALAALMKCIQVDGETAFVPGGLDMLVKPVFAKRGMHLNGWPLRYPYSFRGWREEDWRRYLDILSNQGVNLFYLWPFIEIMPVPLSAEDRAYLEECRRVIDYAQKNHGMEVWIMQCTNRVADDRCGVADPRLRPYWRPAVQRDLNPGNADDFRAILESREAMYRVLDNADGVCNIDSDPGFCPNSPVGDYVMVLQACRTMLDAHNSHGKQTKLVHWMLWGWGMPGVGSTEGLAERQRLVLQAVKAGLPEPLWLISGQFPEYLPMCRDEGLLAKTLYLPYGMIEFEPAYPRTTVEIEAIRKMYRGPDAQTPGLAGIMGNAQTPLLQFPNLYFFTSAWSDSRYLDRSEKEVLLELAGHLYPDHRTLLADGYLALKESDPGKIDSIANRLEEVLRQNRIGRLGMIGRKLFPDSRIVAQSLLPQLRLRAARQRLMQHAAPTSQTDCAKLLADYFDAYLTWDLAHGWHELWSWEKWPLGESEPPVKIARQLRKCLANDADVNACLDEVARTLSAKYDATIVEQGCIKPVREAR